MAGETIHIKLPDNNEEKNLDSALKAIYDAMIERGIDPIWQIVGWLKTEDPTYITSHKDARKLANRIDPKDLLHFFVENYFNENK